MVLTWLIKGVLYKKKFITNFLLYMKMSENTDLTYYQKKREVVLNKAKYYYENNNVRLREQARDNTGTYLKKKKKKKREYGKNRYHNMSEENKNSQYNNG